MSDHKLCVDCVHHHSEGDYPVGHFCTFGIDQSTDLVTGIRQFVLPNGHEQSCDFQRGCTGSCGPDGKNFELSQSLGVRFNRWISGRSTGGAK